MLPHGKKLPFSLVVSVVAFIFGGQQSGPLSYWSVKKVPLRLVVGEEGPCYHGGQTDKWHFYRWLKFADCLGNP